MAENPPHRKMLEQERLLKSVTSGGTLIIYLDGDIDHHSAAILRDESDRGLNREFIKEIVFNFDGVQFMDSSGIGLIMGRYRQAGYNNAKVSLINVPANVDRMLEMAGIYSIIKDVHRV